MANNYNQNFSIKPAFLQEEDAEDDFEFDKIRTFQKKALEWGDNKQSKDLLLLQAPTGAGKTLVFKELAENNDISLAIYPTNSLLEQQKETFEKFGLNAKIISSDTLTGSGFDRRDDLASFSQPPYKEDILLTNPDILQAITSNTYVDPGNKLSTFFESMDTVIYDEFHFYNSFEASGIISQIKLFSEKLQRSDKNPDIILSSATPQEDYLEFMSEELKIPLRRVQVTGGQTAGSKFRHKTDLYTRSEQMHEHTMDIISQLKTAIKNNNYNEPSIALIFNSAKHSNMFQNKLRKHEPEIADLTKKDNGYDTHANKENNDFIILNTTSKGEVGLDFDIEHLYMDHPGHASAFLQRIGRAGRSSKAEVFVHGLNQLNWNKTLFYPSFVDNVYSSFDNKSASNSTIKELIGLRGAAAAYSRQNDNFNYSNETYEDHNLVNTYGKWKQFIDEIYKEHNGFGKGPDEQAQALVDYIKDAMTEIVPSLRGSSVSAIVNYRQGESKITTEYDLLTSISHYKVKEVRKDNDRIEINLGQDRDDPTNVRVDLSHINIEEDYYEYRYNSISQEQLNSILQNSNFLQCHDIEKEQIFHLFELLGPNKLISSIRCPEMEIHI